MVVSLASASSWSCFFRKKCLIRDTKKKPPKPTSLQMFERVYFVLAGKSMVFELLVCVVERGVFCELRFWFLLLKQ